MHPHADQTSVLTARLPHGADVEAIFLPTDSQSCIQTQLRANATQALADACINVATLDADSRPSASVPVHVMFDTDWPMLSAADKLAIRQGVAVGATSLVLIATAGASLPELRSVLNEACAVDMTSINALAKVVLPSGTPSASLAASTTTPNPASFAVGPLLAGLQSQPVAFSGVRTTVARDVAVTPNGQTTALLFGSDGKPLCTLIGEPCSAPP